MRISELSERSGIPIPTIKLYLREGLLFRGKRTARNQAEYAEGHVRRLHLIRALTEVGGLSLIAVRRVLEAIDDERVPLIDMLGVAHFALGPTPDGTPPSADLVKALAEVDRFLAGLQWTVDPDAPAKRSLAHALVTLRRLGHDTNVQAFLPYADAADRLAKQEVISIDSTEHRGQVVEDIVLGTIVFEAALVALRRLAEEHHAKIRFARRGDRLRKPVGPKRTPK
jgi:DNA-binding transcriptional MerR regulator